MTVREWRDLSGYWERHPPAAELLEVLAVHAGWKAADSSRAKPLDEAGLAALESDLSAAESGVR